MESRYKRAASLLEFAMVCGITNGVVGSTLESAYRLAISLLNERGDAEIEEWGKMLQVMNNRV